MILFCRAPFYFLVGTSHLLIFHLLAKFWNHVKSTFKKHALAELFPKINPADVPSATFESKMIFLLKRTI